MVVQMELNLEIVTYIQKLVSIGKTAIGILLKTQSVIEKKLYKF